MHPLQGWLGVISLFPAVLLRVRLPVGDLSFSTGSAWFQNLIPFSSEPVMARIAAKKAPSWARVQQPFSAGRIRRSCMHQPPDGPRFLAVVQG